MNYNLATWFKEIGGDRSRLRKEQKIQCVGIRDFARNPITDYRVPLHKGSQFRIKTGLCVCRRDILTVHITARVEGKCQQPTA